MSKWVVGGSVVIFIMLLMVVGSGWGGQRNLIDKQKMPTELSTPTELPSDPNAVIQEISPTVPYHTPTFTLPSVVPTIILSHLMNQVPFVSQAPFAQWQDDRFQNACEEAAMIMVMAWVKNKTVVTKTDAEQEILALVDYELAEYGQAVDHSAADVAAIIQGYYRHDRVWVEPVAEVTGIIRALSEGKLVIVPMNGRKLGNPNFTPPGPLQHMVVVIGYDLDKRELITNDPGTRKGEGYRYDFDVFVQAIRDYPTGKHEPITTEEKRMIVVGE